MRLDGIQVKSNPEALAELARLGAQVEPPDCIVEVGVFQGGSLATIASNASAHCFGVDPWAEQPAVYADRPHLIRAFGPRTQGIAQAHLERKGVADRCTLVKGYSIDVARTWQRPIGMLYIDGNHAYDAVHADWQAWCSHLVAGATVVFDDYDFVRPRFASVIKAVTELVEAHQIEPVVHVAGRLAVTRSL